MGVVAEVASQMFRERAVLRGYLLRLPQNPAHMVTTGSRTAWGLEISNARSLVPQRLVSLIGIQSHLGTFTLTRTTPFRTSSTPALTISSSYASGP
jgi:hypothetical protein